MHPPLGERSQRGANAARVGKRRSRARGLLNGAPANAASALSVQYRGTFEPAD